MPTTLLARLRIRRDTYANLYATNRVYGRGEPVYDETNDLLKVGDGITAWRDLDYMDAEAFLASLKDVQLNLGTLADGQALVYNASLQKWVNSTAGGSPSGAAGGDLSGNYPNPTVAPGAIGTSKLGGDITAAGKALLDDLDNVAQRTTLGLGTVATQDANAVALTGGTISGVNVVTGTYQSPANEALMKIVRKASAGTITKGQVVYIVGSQGTHLTVELADADSELTAATTIGVAAETITNTVSGYIITQGLLTGLSNLPTGTFVNGNALWLSQTAGNWTTTKPVQPAHLVFLGWVQDASNGAAGRAYVKVINGQELDELHDVLIGASPADNDLLAYDLSSGLWKNQTAAEAGLAASSHTHGNITNAGAIGSTASLPIITGTGGVLQAGSFGSTTGTFCEGNDSRLTNSRTPTGAAGGSLTGTYPDPGIAANAVTNTAIRDSAANSVIGRAAATAGDPADIQATVDGQVLRLSGTTLGFGTLATAGIGDSQITYAKIQNVATARILGRTTAGAGVVEELSAGANLSLSAGTLAVTASGSTGQVQYNSSNALTASSVFTFDGSNVQVGSQGQLRLGSSGATFVALRSPSSVANSNIYTLPDVVGSNGQVLQIASVSGNDATLQWATVSGGGGGAPTTVDYLVRTADATLTNERVVGNSNTVSANWVTAGQVSFERAALSGDVTASVNSNTTTIANQAVTFAKFQNINTARILGRTTAAAGSVEEISVGSNLSLSAGTLAVTASGSTTQVQFNNGGALGGHSGLTYNSGTSELTVAGDLAVNGGDITSSSSNFNLAATSVDVRIAAAAAAAPTIRLGTNITGNTVTLNGIAAGTSNLDVNVTTGIVNLFTGITTGTLNMATGGASTINLGGAAASVNIGTTSGDSTLTIRANSLGTATLATTVTSGLGNLFNTFVTNLNIGGAATALTLGATTGTAALRNPTLRLGNTTSSITTNSGSTNSLTISPGGNLTIAPTTSLGSLGGTMAQLQVTNAVDGAGQVRVTGGNLYLGTYSTDGTDSLDVGILFEGATANSFTTRLQAADPGANRTITLPNASGTVGLVAGSTNQVQYNSSGALAASSAFTFDGSHLQVGSQGQVRLGSSTSTYVALRSPSAVTNSNIYTLPAAVGTANQVLQIASVTGNDATLQWATVSGGSGSPGGSSGQIQFNNAGAFAGDAGLTYDSATETLTVGTAGSGAIVMGNGEFLSNSTNGTVRIGTNGTASTDFAMTVDGTSWGSGVTLGTRRNSDGSTTAGGFLCNTPWRMGNAIDFALGGANWYTLSYQEASSQGCMTIGLLLGSQNAGSSGALVIVQNNERGGANRVPTIDHADPTLYLYGRGSSNANHFMRLNHDTTNGVIETGAGDLNLVSASGNINNNGNRIPKVFSGTTTPGAGLGSDGDLYFKY